MATHSAETLPLPKFFLPFPLQFRAGCCSSLCPLRCLAGIQNLWCASGSASLLVRASGKHAFHCVTRRLSVSLPHYHPIPFPTLFRASCRCNCILSPVAHRIRFLTLKCRVDDPPCVAGRHMLSLGLFMLAEFVTCQNASKVALHWGSGGFLGFMIFGASPDAGIAVESLWHPLASYGPMVPLGSRFFQVSNWVNSCWTRRSGISATYLHCRRWWPGRI